MTTRPKYMNFFKQILEGEVNGLYRLGTALEALKYHVEEFIESEARTRLGVKVKANIMVVVHHDKVHLVGTSFYDTLLLNGIYLPEVEHRPNTDFIEVQDGEKFFHHRSLLNRATYYTVTDENRFYNKRAYVPEFYKERLLELL